MDSTDEPIKLSSNESALGSSPQAVAAFRSAAQNLHRYPDGAQTALRAAIAEQYQLPQEQLVCGNGSEELIGLIVRCYVNSGDDVVLTRNHFVMCPIYVRAQNANVILAEERDDHIDVDQILQAITPKTSLVIIANPNNPTGTYIPSSELDRLVNALAPHVMLIIDGAYAEFVVNDDFDDGARHALDRSNVVVTHTFSKIYGLAGLRVGWAVAAGPIIDTINRLRTPFNVNSAALAAATAAVQDQSFVEAARAHNERALKSVLTALREMDFRVTQSVANFYLVDVTSVEGATTADAVRHLEAAGIIPRPAGSDARLRITIGTVEENEAVLSAMRQYRSGLP